MGHFVVVKYLVDTMEDKNPKIDKRHGWTLPHLAAKLGRIDIVKYVMSKVLNIHPKDNHGQTPLHIAATFGKLDVVKLIMEKNERFLLVTRVASRVPEIDLQWSLGCSR